MEFLKEHSYVMWLGFSLAAFTDMNINQWEYWVTIVPLMILIIWKTDND